MKKHLAIFVGSAIDDIIFGRKTIESRFSLGRVLPYGQIAKDDEILLKKSGGDVIGRVIADNVLYYDNLTPESIAILRKEYNKELCVSDNFWQAKSKSRFGTIIFLKGAERFLVPIKIFKKDRRPWVILEK